MTPPVMGCNPRKTLSDQAYKDRLSEEQTYSSVVHSGRVDRKHRGECEDDAHEERPQDAVHIRNPTDDPVTHVEWVPGQPLLISSGEDNSVKVRLCLSALAGILNFCTVAMAL